MRNRVILFLILPVLAYLTACSPQNSKTIVAKYDDHQIDMGEFEEAFSRNSPGVEKTAADSIEAMKKFLDLYVNYKMKLRDAYIRGYHTDPDMQQELRSYKINVGKTLYLDKVLYEPNLKKLYDRRKYELRVSHIFLAPDSTMDNTAVVKLGDELIARIKNGEDFSELVKKYSKDNYTKNTGGDVYYVTAGQIYMPTLEDAAYVTPVGEVYPHVVKSNYGYHIVKVTDKRLRKPAVRLEHIFIPYQDTTGRPDSIKALRKITDIYNKLKAGEDYTELAKKYSEDKASAPKGGDIGFVERGRLPKEMDEAAFNLNEGQVSDIIASPYGYHILRVEDTKELPTFDEDRENLKKMYEKVRFKEDYNKLIDSLKINSGFKVNTSVLSSLLARTDSVKLSNAYWKSSVKNEIGDSVIFSYNKSNVTVDSLMADIIKRDGNPKTINSQFISESINKYSGDLLIDQEALNFDKSDKNFAYLMKEYESGIYLFKILDDEVWSKIKVDSVGLEKFYESTKQNYTFPDRVEYKEIWVSTDSAAQNTFAMLKSGYDFDSLFVKYSEKKPKPGSNGQSAPEMVNADASELSKKAFSLSKEGDFSTPFESAGGWAIVKLIKKDPSRLKTLDEAKAEAASQYQEQESKLLETEYLNRLKNLYHPVYYYDEFQKAFKK